MTPIGIALLASTILAVVATAPDDGGALSSCGTRALYTLLRLEGHPADLTELGEDLGRPARGGHSMLDLRRVARHHGLRLEGVRLETSPGRPAPDRPMLALLDRKPHGHFVVVRPVGHTGALVQVLDPNGEEPMVVDTARLYAHPHWTGIALVARRPDRSAWIVRALILLGIIGASSLSRRGRPLVARRRPTRPD